jgi:hypothetical protein
MLRFDRQARRHTSPQNRSAAALTHGRVLLEKAEEAPADAAKAVDGHLDHHAAALCCCVGVVRVCVREREGRSESQFFLVRLPRRNLNKFARRNKSGPPLKPHTPHPHTPTVAMVAVNDDPATAVAVQLNTEDVTGIDITPGSAAELQSGSSSQKKPRGVAPVRNLYIASTSYVGFTLTDGALRLVVLLYADSLGFNAIEIAVMFSLYEASRRRCHTHFAASRMNMQVYYSCWFCYRLVLNEQQYLQLTKHYDSHPRYTMCAALAHARARTTAAAAATLLCCLPLLLQVAGIFTNFFGGVAGSKFGLFCMLMSSLVLQILCLVSVRCLVSCAKIACNTQLYRSIS